MVSQSNNGSRFGRRPLDGAGTPDGASGRSSNLEQARSHVAELVAQWHAGNAATRGPILIQIRSIQDQISGLRHRFPQLAARPSEMSWVDIWSPP